MAKGKVGKSIKKRAVKLAKSKKYEPGLIPGQPAAGHHAFKSRAQARLFFANPKLRRWAIGKAHATGMHSEITAAVGHSPAYHALPERKPGSTTAHRIKHAALKGRSL